MDKVKIAIKRAGFEVFKTNKKEVDESYSAELVKLIASALLYVTMTDLYADGTTIHGLQPNQWVINNDYNKKI